MKRFWGSVLFLVLAAVPLFTFAAGLVPCGGADEPACQTCHVVQLVNGVISWLVLILGTVAAIIIVYAGFKLVMSGGNRHAKEEAKSMLSNMIIGYVIVLAGWLLVDTGMKVLLADGETKLGMWNQLSCYEQPEPKGRTFTPENFDPNVAIPKPYVPPGVISEWVGPAPSGYVQGNCSPENLMRYGMNASQAKVFSCIARPESNCILNAQNPWTSARGVFQIVRGLNDRCHNLNLPQCTAAARAKGYNVSGDLNCSTAFAGGTSPSNPSRPKPGKEALYNACNAATDDLGCNVAAALCLYQNGGYNHWISDPAASTQRACVQSGGGTTNVQ